ncbi:acyl-CoA thioesterase [Actinokineospora bangkokensis]|uniref:Thioesterase n=1 Tax=Actinokineospora bangkokensis TaxID=1193682 RepID=A0A1Q9LDX5_9PSEU|nr:acyl-CoA thioesterase [Actinokineospora bangkokensis]OLR90216.1 thioesterase [Actinokineospora bangkokensis]
MSTPWTTRVRVRSFELDALGHVNQAVYHQYGEIARVEGFAAAGCDWQSLTASGASPVLLGSTIAYRRELRAGDAVDITCELKFGSGKTFDCRSVMTKLDGTVSAELTCVLGVMDLTARKLVADPRAAMESCGLDLSVLNG